MTLLLEQLFNSVNIEFTLVMKTITALFLDQLVRLISANFPAYETRYFKECRYFIKHYYCDSFV